MTVEQIAAEAMNLPAEKRAELADRIVESLDAAQLNHFDMLWASESRRRLDEILTNKVKTISGDEALARARQVASE